MENVVGTQSPEMLDAMDRVRNHIVFAEHLADKIDGGEVEPENISMVHESAMLHCRIAEVLAGIWRH